MYTPSNNRRPSRGRSFGGQSSSNRRSGGPKNHKQNINPSRFIKPATAFVDEVYTSEHSFDDFAMHPLLKKNIATKGYITPSPIQDKAIPHGLMGKDVLGIANTGTGKTAAFALPVLHKLLEQPGSRVLIIAPTRELAEQIEDECRSFAKGSGLFGVLLIGGASMTNQLRDLKKKPEIVIGTPGRIKDHVERGTLSLSTFNLVVLDEVDRMVDMGFIADIRYLLGGIPEVRQSLFFSATIEPKIAQLINTFLIDPITISVRTSETSDNVEQDVVYYSGRDDRIDKLHDVLNSAKDGKVLIFDETKFGVERLGNELVQRGFKADALHGGKSQSQRQRALKRFRTNDINVLVATDVAARGIDVADITHVINYATPNTYEDYVHRIGRAGRAGRTGTALTFISR
ncbi:MAG: putative box helicase domain protein [Candidatus Saccharibacteria bacterium]|nr:putative box helicase domain protein [Candidatus Saccharibacteria bacterium]